jgi:hypothetical protein
MSWVKIAGEHRMYGGDGEVLEDAAAKPSASAQHCNGAISLRLHTYASVHLLLAER